MRTDPDKEEAFVHSKDWGTGIVDLVYAVKGDSIGEGPRMRMNSFSGGERNRLFLAGLNYSDVSLLSGIDCSEDGRGFALWDYNNDGFQDVIVMSPMTPRVRVFRNEIPKVLGAKGGRIALKLRGGNNGNKSSSNLSNRDAVGAKIIVTGTDGEKRMFQRAIGEGFASQNSGWIWIGMGEQLEALTIEVIWPSGKQTKLKKVKTGTKLEVFEAH